MLPGGSRIICMIHHLLPGLDLYCADPAQPLTTAGEELDYPDHDLSKVSVIVRRAIRLCAAWALTSITHNIPRKKAEPMETVAIDSILRDYLRLVTWKHGRQSVKDIWGSHTAALYSELHPVEPNPTFSLAERGLFTTKTSHDYKLSQARFCQSGWLGRPRSMLRILIW